MASPETQLTPEQAKELSRRGYTVYNPNPQYPAGTLIGAGTVYLPGEKIQTTTGFYSPIDIPNLPYKIDGSKGEEPLTISDEQGTRTYLVPVRRQTIPAIAGQPKEKRELATEQEPPMYDLPYRELSEVEKIQYPREYVAQMERKKEAMQKRSFVSELPPEAQPDMQTKIKNTLTQSYGTIKHDIYSAWTSPNATKELFTWGGAGYVAGRLISITPYGRAISTVATVALIGKSLLDVGATKTASGLLSPGAIGFMGGAGLASGGKSPKQWEVKKASQFTVLERGSFDALTGKAVRTTVVRPQDTYTVLMKEPPKPEPTSEAVIIQRMRGATPNKLFDITIKETGTLPTGLFRQPAEGWGTTGARGIFDAEKAVARTETGIAATLALKSAQSPSPPALPGATTPGAFSYPQKLSVDTLLLKRLTEFGTEVKTKVVKVFSAREAGKGLEVPAAFGIEVKTAGGLKAPSYRQFFSGYIKVKDNLIAGVKSSRAYRKLYAGDTTIIKTEQELTGSIPDLVYAKEAEIQLIGKPQPNAPPETILFKPAPGLGIKNALDLKIASLKSMIGTAKTKATAAQKTAGALLKKIKPREDSTIKFLREKYAAELKTANLLKEKAREEIQARMIRNQRPNWNKIFSGKKEKPMQSNRLIHLDLADRIDMPAQDVAPRSVILQIKEVGGGQGAGNLLVSMPRKTVSSTQRPQSAPPLFKQKSAEKLIELEMPKPSINTRITQTPIIKPKQKPGLFDLQTPRVRQEQKPIELIVPQERQGQTQIFKQLTTPKQPPQQTPKPKPRPGETPPKAKPITAFSDFGKSVLKTRNIKKTVQPLKTSRQRLADWWSVNKTEMATQKRALHPKITGAKAKAFDLKLIREGAGFRYPTVQMQKGVVK